VEGILREIPIATYVRNDYYDDSWMAGVNVRAEEANRLGLTNASIAQQLLGAFSGSSVTTYWEGDRQVDVLLRLDANQRRSFDDVRNAYLTSTLTGQRVPLRSVAELKPAWQITRIVRRNVERRKWHPFRALESRLVRNPTSSRRVSTKSSHNESCRQAIGSGLRIGLRSYRYR
jgi:multidrug efflux pump subunit AcrB